MAATPMFDLAVPGHERDELAGLRYTSHNEPIDVIGLDDAERELDALALREFAAADDDDVYLPTRHDELVAAMAAQG